uniref:Uncharacterized protein LOC111117830 n=1 Tax=Crassostrea virginica TaxID=6565 RepID=A0A8B8CAU2_CRAVI|nr:uncharacterized protein LOC111117830 [Crassostrea virginica]
MEMARLVGVLALRCVKSSGFPKDTFFPLAPEFVNIVRNLPATCRIDFAKELGGDLSSFQCIAAADKNTCMDFESCSTQSSCCGPSQLVSSAESSLFLLSQQSSQDWFELNRSPREKLNEALHDLSSKEFVPIASQVSSPWED